MLSAPTDLTPELRTDALDRHWGVSAAELTYRPVGFGSHHWVLAGTGEPVVRLTPGYAAALHPDVRPELLEMYRLRWDLADLAVAVDEFRRPHGATADTARSFEILRQVLAGICP